MTAQTFIGTCSSACFRAVSDEPFGPRSAKRPLHRLGGEDRSDRVHVAAADRVVQAPFRRAKGGKEPEPLVDAGAVGFAIDGNPDPDRLRARLPDLGARAGRIVVPV